MRQSNKSVLILGGHGAAGAAIATLLGQRIDGNIVLAGRSLEKGRERAEQLDRPGNTGQSWHQINKVVSGLAGATTGSEQKNLVNDLASDGKRFRAHDAMYEDSRLYSSSIQCQRI
ncbi:hypothetical protein [Marinobacter salarius]|jgi:shikimate 5-dehydrogenase|uniref:Ketoreductase (KR) domain-containing protein n=1 Tax=Marinobacter salarius TaxID=1420917 RepID=A0A1W6KBK0_9GAMM|nr:MULTISPECIES: hypothetical protein [Marinobacter]ARM84793.1 hypothetical protein MARSALSMR5_02742 [Marinobacter salarius]AZR39707.1 hypothetical protein MTMN5_00233 [Marinobacter salarius]MCS5583652.1 hypothetical protein [Pseudomonadales bacterium]